MGNLVELSKEFCIHYHHGQFRKGNNLPYHTHPFAVAAILDRYGYSDPVTQCMANLHDTTEDTPLKHKEIYEVFGFEIANGVYILDKNTIDDFTIEQFSNFVGKQIDRPTAYKMRIAFAREKIQRCKIADTVHNTQDLVTLKQSSIEEKIRDSEEFYIPLGMRCAPLMVRELAQNIANYRTLSSIR